MTTITPLHPTREAEIDDLLEALDAMAKNASNAGKILRRIKAGEPVTKPMRVLLATHLLMTIPAGIEPLRQVGVLLREDIENTAVDQIEHDLLTLMDMWREEQVRASKVGETPRAVRHAGYVVGPEGFQGHLP